MKAIEDYKNYKSENKFLFNYLEKQTPILYSGINNCVIILDYILKNPQKLEGEDLVTDYAFSYLFSIIEFIKVLYKETFTSNLSLIEKYQLLLHYYFIVEEMKTIIEKSQPLNDLSSYILNIVEKKLEYTNETVDYIDSIISSYPTNVCDYFMDEILSKIIIEENIK